MSLRVRVPQRPPIFRGVMQGVFLESLKKDLFKIDPQYAEIFSGHERVYSPTYLESLVQKLLMEKDCYIPSDWYILYRLAQLGNKLKSYKPTQSLCDYYNTCLDEETLKKFPFASKDKKAIEDL